VEVVPAAAAVAAAVAPSTQRHVSRVLEEQPLQQGQQVRSERLGSYTSDEHAAAAGGSGGGSFTAPAAKVAAAAARAAEEAAELEQAAATAAAVMSRSMSGHHRHSSGRVDDSMAKLNSFSSRSAGTQHKSACQQIWGGGGGSLSGHPSLDGAAEQQALGRHQRKRRATKQLYDTGSEASESDGSEKPATNGRSITNNRQRNGSRSRGNSAVAVAAAAAAAAVAAAEEEEEGEQPHDFMAVKKRRLLEAEGDAAGSDSEATDLESLAMVAMAMAQLANGAGDWQHRADNQQRGVEAAAAAMEVDEAAAAAVKVDAGSDGGGAAPVVHCKAEAYGSDDAEAEEGRDSRPLQLQQYEHSGEGLPCLHSWQYAVPMPGCAAVPAAAASSPAAGSSSASNISQEGKAVPAVTAIAVPAAAAAPSSAYYVQLFSGFAGAAAEDLDTQQQGSADDSAGLEQLELAAVDGLTAVADAAAAAAAVVAEGEAVTEAAGLAGLQALAAGAVAAGQMPPPPAAAAAGGQYGAFAGLAGPGAFAGDPAAAAAAVVGAASFAASMHGGAQRCAPDMQQHIAAANALCAAFTASVPGSAAALHGGHPHKHHYAMPCQHNSSSAAAMSDRSAGSAGQRIGGSSFSSKRRNAAALAAAHTITPPNPALDAIVAELLLRPDGPRLPLQQGLPDSGFRLPRELLMNRPPKFEWLKRNTFVSRERPKRLAKHDVHVCNCR
jgi:hypothetical protein